MNQVFSLRNIAEQQASGELLLSGVNIETDKEIQLKYPLYFGVYSIFHKNISIFHYTQNHHYQTYFLHKKRILNKYLSLLSKNEKYEEFFPQISN